MPVVAIGTEYKWLNPVWLPHWDVAVRSGYTTRSEDPVPDATFNPGVISPSSNTLSLGAGFLCKDQGRFLGIVACGGVSGLWPKAIGLDVAFQEWFYESRGVVGNLYPPSTGPTMPMCIWEPSAQSLCSNCFVGLIPRLIPPGQLVQGITDQFRGGRKLEFVSEAWRDTCSPSSYSGPGNVRCA